MAYRRKLRHGLFARVRYQRRLLTFLAAQTTRLTSSASSTTVDTVDVAAVKALATLTNDGTQPADTSTVVIGGKTYTFQSALTEVDGHVKIGASNTATMTNLFHAINASGGSAGTDYATATVAHTTVDATNPTGTTVVATAKTAGVAGNQIAATVGGTSHGTWSNNTLTGGADATFGPTLTAAAHAITNGEGPYVITAATTLPGGYTAATLVWVGVVDANTIGLARSRADAILGHFISFTSAGVGALTLKKALSNAGMFNLLKAHTPASLVAASDIDSLN